MIVYNLNEVKRGIEPLTSCLQNRCSGQLSYFTIVRKTTLIAIKQCKRVVLCYGRVATSDTSSEALLDITPFYDLVANTLYPLGLANQSAHEVSLKLIS